MLYKFNWRNIVFIDIGIYEMSLKIINLYENLITYLLSKYIYEIPGELWILIRDY